MTEIRRYKLAEDEIRRAISHWLDQDGFDGHVIEMNIGTVIVEASRKPQVVGASRGDCMMQSKLSDKDR